MVEIFAGRDPRQQADGGHAAIDDGRRDRRRRHRLARTARVLRTNMPMHEEARRLHVQLFADVLADLDQVGTASAALARLRLVAVLDARQLRRQRLASGALALALGRRLAVEFLLDGRQVHVERFLEQQALLADERLAGLAETDPPIIGQLVRQRGDLEILLGQLGLLLCEQRLHLRQQGWVDVGAGKFVEQVHSAAVYRAWRTFTSKTVYVVTSATALARVPTGAASPRRRPASAIVPRSSANTLRFPRQTGHPFHGKLDTHSTPNWTSGPAQTGHRFRSKLDSLKRPE